ncbi:hypothetical protein CASFOL_005188 [Castilleja foliolosa]|uniref:Uncharacterized protein n=1 Tax=Castilleja foliolosa TaxID=1961234 RepID=A0ABD3E2P7_9LAMI
MSAYFRSRRRRFLGRRKTNSRIFSRKRAAERLIKAQSGPDFTKSPTDDTGIKKSESVNRLSENAKLEESLGIDLIELSCRMTPTNNSSHYLIIFEFNLSILFADFVCIDADPGNDLNVYCISWIGFSRMRMKIYYFDSFKFSAGFLFNFTGNQEAPYLVLAAVELVLWIAIKYIDPREASV